MILKLRTAFSMITAIFVIVIMSTVTALVMGTAGKIVKETTAQYQKEQAVLLAKSYTELAIMAVSANKDRNVTGNCLDTINGTFTEGGGYTIVTEISYILGPGVTTTCTNILNAGAPAVTPESALNIIVDVYVRYKDLDNSSGNDITYHRRTLQKI